jgi:alanyl-tRNA synthetase
MQSWGIPADTVSEICKMPVPGNLYYEISLRQERVTKAAETILYSTAHIPETRNLYYEDHLNYNFESKVLEVFSNVLKNGLMNILILEASAFYPTSGGQVHDTGKVWVAGEQYEIINVEKVGKCVLHFLDREIDLKDPEKYKGQPIKCEIDA